MMMLVSTSLAFALIFAPGSSNAEGLLRKPRGLAQELRLLDTVNQTEVDIAMLESDACEAFMLEMDAQLNDMLSYEDNTLLSYMCNAVERNEAKGSLEAMAAAVEGAADDTTGTRMLVETDPCMLAYERVILAQKEKAGFVLDSWGSCREEVEMELVAIRGEDRRSRALLSGSHRQLLVIQILGVVIFGIMIWRTVAMYT